MGRRGNWRSRTASAAYRSASGTSSGSRSGSSAKISCVVIPSATMATTVDTGIRRPRKVGAPPINSGSTVIRVNSMISGYASGGVLDGFLGWIAVVIACARFASTVCALEVEMMLSFGGLDVETLAVNQASERRAQIGRLRTSIFVADIDSCVSPSPA